ncbi:hypothetical protein [Polyangium spumosum]|uniref:Uncharacterized protein n=1 Tax=Polyangium spumosum TaxID=889282 RepID=A0A6N7PXI0_9BACT|nr:hypothetical protein [Polyangium spumosum]MRG96227.1 hypothetical protein [Polyangium spumosum]
MIHERIPFVRPVFRGARFEGHALPVEVLGELVAYRDLVVELARHLFLTSTPGRARVPRGFFESFQIAITGIGEGSTIPEVDRIRPPRDQTPPVLPETPDYFDEARDLVELVIACASRREPVPPAFPFTLMPRLQRMGRSLRPDESIELRAPGKPSGPRLDRTIRRRLMLQEETSIEDDFDVIGEIVGGHKDRRLLFVRLDDGHEIEITREPGDVQKLLTFSGRRVRVVGEGLFNREERLERVLRVEDLDVVGVEHADAEDPPAERPSPIDDQIDDLRALPPDWYEQGTPALDPEGLERLRRFLHKVVEGVAVPRPYLYPTPEGGARAEWSLGGWDVSATFDLRAGLAELHAAELAGEGMAEEQLSLGEPDAAVYMRRFLQRFIALGGSAR